MTEATFGALTIRAGEGVPDMEMVGPLKGRYRRKYNVRVKSDDTGNEIRFNFTDSIAHYEEGRKGLGADDLLWAFRCFVDDAAYGEMELDDFASELGYQDSVSEAIRVHKACQKAAKKFAKLYSDGRDVYDVLERLQLEGVE